MRLWQTCWSGISCSKDISAWCDGYRHISLLRYGASFHSHQHSGRIYCYMLINLSHNPIRLVLLSHSTGEETEVQRNKHTWYKISQLITNRLKVWSQACPAINLPFLCPTMPFYLFSFVEIQAQFFFIATHFFINVS